MTTNTKDMKEGQMVKTPHGEATITRIEDVFGSHDDRVSIVFPDGRTSQYSSSSIVPLPYKK